MSGIFLFFLQSQKVLFGSTSLHCWPEAVAAHAQGGLGQAGPGHGTSAGSECSSTALVVVDESTVKAGRALGAFCMLPLQQCLVFWLASPILYCVPVPIAPADIMGSPARLPQDCGSIQRIQRYLSIQR